MHMFLRLAKAEYSAAQRRLPLILEHVIFLLAIPYGFISIAALSDQYLGIPRFGGALINALALAFSPVGALTASSTILVHVFSGQGTPNPLMPTRKLITHGPYAFVRSPMALGAITLYLGLSLWIGSPSALVIAVAASSVVLLYNRVIEEKELELRFGKAFTKYRQRTAFIVPSCTRNPERTHPSPHTNHAT